MDSIQITVNSGYLPEQSSPQQQRYAFYYTITISNLGYAPVQLLSRHWIITDANNHREEVQGEGVVGEQPIIEANNYYRYNSGAMLKTPYGSMEGSYLFIDDDNQEFTVPIPLFSLLTPNALN